MLDLFHGIFLPEGFSYFLFLLYLKIGAGFATLFSRVTFFRVLGPSLRLLLRR